MRSHFKNQFKKKKNTILGSCDQLSPAINLQETFPI